ncbi:MAG: 2-octaprenyl-3-methyl-6-methoxy-1,4-benzoquinol hydroxylase [Gammaproteobacteria bacterium RIFCSPLOWO2_12_47_11]|nr:MAG: 2-octaprenyl-3-methyl-6-methoxy-1,4-benzoquinol hydroxylase [Gammaproteobacteria bacterium RIFCSPLOWO2_12_47_11]
MLERHYGIIDQLIIRFDQQLTRHRAAAKAAGRDSPADTVTDITLNSAERDHVEGLMRVNHAGEVAAQALYQGQALISRDPVVRQSMRCSADEEIDHLDWCKKRLDELGGHTSYLNPVWYLGSFSIGALAGLAGDKWSLGFVAETERQVVEHLQAHLQRLPEKDRKSRAILQQMMEDEARHGTVAMTIGGIELPAVVKSGMRLCSKVMTRTAYWI